MFNISATNRGAKREKNDNYPTPEWTIRLLLDNYQFKEGRILEPCAGCGNISKLIKEYYPNYELDQVELRSEENNLKLYGNVYIEDYLKWNNINTYQTICTNPPYSLAIECIKKSLSISNEVIMLCRLGLLESKNRYEFWQQYPVNKLLVLSKRPSFKGKGTDATIYGWFIWDGSNKQEIKVIR